MRTIKISPIIKIFCIYLLCLSSNSGFAQTTGGVGGGFGGGGPGGGEANPNLKTNEQALKRWQTMRFGMFIHWGPVSLRGTEIGWSRGESVSIEDYDNLYKEFNPVLFNAAEWVKTAREAGMKYIVIVSKHHDGFTMWDSKVTDYKITSSPFRRDVLREISDECRKQGILFCTYYSIADWHNPNYATRHGTDSRQIDSANMPEYIKYLKAQVSELILNYGSNILWFDGEWEGAWSHQAGMDLYHFCRNLKDDILINNRVDKGRDGMKGKTVSDMFAGDFGTPEQEVGNYDNEHAWESCITICNQWSWKPNDSLKTLKECMEILERSSGGGGNLLLNVSPMPDGRMEQRQINRLKEIGAWLNDNGESIYGTRGGPYKPSDDMVSTRIGNKIYLHFFNLPNDKIRIPMLGKRIIKSIKTIGGKEIEFSKENNSILINVQNLPFKIDSILVLELDGSALDIEDIPMPSHKKH
jgi:alpha-L-fucosidase